MGRQLVHSITKGRAEVTVTHRFTDGEIVKVDCDVLSNDLVSNEVKVGAGGFGYFSGKEFPRTLVLVEAGQINEVRVWCLKSPATGKTGPSRFLARAFRDVIYYRIEFDWWDVFQ